MLLFVVDGAAICAVSELLRAGTGAVPPGVRAMENDDLTRGGRGRRRARLIVQSIAMLWQ